jgi:hypothetical protein
MSNAYNFNGSMDALDAHIFSGDALYIPANRELLKEHCERWLRAIADITANEDGAADEALARTGRHP